MDRREQILETAAGLFAERGFHGVSVHDIGAACGISGPALYKHFNGKHDLLTESLTGISQHLLSGGKSCQKPSAKDTLAALIEFHIDFALGHPNRIVIQEREWANLDETARQAVRNLQLAYIDIWVRTLRQLRPELDTAEARAAVQAAFGLLNSTPHSARINETRMRALLTDMATKGLLPSPTP